MIPSPKMITLSKHTGGARDRIQQPHFHCRPTPCTGEVKHVPCVTTCEAFHGAGGCHTMEVTTRAQREVSPREERVPDVVGRARPLTSRRLGEKARVCSQPASESLLSHISQLQGGVRPAAAEAGCRRRAGNAFWPRINSDAHSNKNIYIVSSNL